MREQGRILITGATGNVGRHVVSGLLDAGVDVSALTRNPYPAGLPNGVEIVQGDLSDPGTLEAVLEGVEAVFLVWPFLTTEAAPAVLDAFAKPARRIVYLSSMSIRDDLEEQSDPISAFHADIECLIERTGMEWTFLRPSGFATNTLAWAEQIRTDGVVRWPYGEAARSLIHERDIAAVAVRALTEDGHDGARHLLSGPRALTQAEQVQTIGEAIGRPVRWEELPREKARRELVDVFGDASFADGALEAWAGFVTRPERVTSTVEEVSGRPASTFRQWANDHAGDFR